MRADQALPRKLKEAYRWALTHTDAPWILKVDDDMFVHMAELEMLFASKSADGLEIFGRIQNDAPVHAGVKWKKHQEDSHPFGTASLIWVAALLISAVGLTFAGAAPDRFGARRVRTWYTLALRIVHRGAISMVQALRRCLERRGLFYGWIIVAASGLLLVSTTVGHNTGVNMVVDTNVVHELNVPRTTSYPPFPLGSSGHAVTRALAEAVVVHDGHEYYGEDVSLGIWADEINADVRFVLAEQHFITAVNAVTKCTDKRHIVIGHGLSPANIRTCFLRNRPIGLPHREVTGDFAIKFSQSFSQDGTTGPLFTPSKSKVLMSEIKTGLLVTKMSKTSIQQKLAEDANFVKSVMSSSAGFDFTAEEELRTIKNQMKPTMVYETVQHHVHHDARFKAALIRYHTDDAAEIQAMNNVDPFNGLTLLEQIETLQSMSQQQSLKVASDIVDAAVTRIGAAAGSIPPKVQHAITGQIMKHYFESDPKTVEMWLLLDTELIPKFSEYATTHCNMIAREFQSDSYTETCALLAVYYDDDVNAKITQYAKEVDATKMQWNTLLDADSYKDLPSQWARRYGQEIQALDGDRFKYRYGDDHGVQRLKHVTEMQDYGAERLIKKLLAIAAMDGNVLFQEAIRNAVKGQKRQHLLYQSFFVRE